MNLTRKTFLSVWQQIIFENYQWYDTPIAYKHGKKLKKKLKKSYTFAYRQLKTPLLAISRKFEILICYNVAHIVEHIQQQLFVTGINCITISWPHTDLRLVCLAGYTILELEARSQGQEKNFRPLHNIRLSAMP